MQLSLYPEREQNKIRAEFGIPWGVLKQFLNRDEDN